MFVKKRISLFFALLLSAMMLFGGCAAQAEDKVFVTSFYPMYVFAQNVVKDVPGVRVVNMTGSNAGCLHDYQLQTRDMVMLEDATALLINGGGMEQFVDKVAGMYAGLPVINASAGIDMLCAEEESGHDHGNDRGCDFIGNGHCGGHIDGQNRCNGGGGDVHQIVAHKHGGQGKIVMVVNKTNQFLRGGLRLALFFFFFNVYNFACFLNDNAVHS